MVKATTTAAAVTTTTTIIIQYSFIDVLAEQSIGQLQNRHNINTTIT
jgi:hypothetical protein